MDHREIGWENVDWINLGQDRDQWWTLMNAVSGKFIDYLSD
jgi:hypothetical protein